VTAPTTPADTRSADPATSTASPLTRALGLLSLAAVALSAWLGLVASPRDVIQGDSVRLMYVHVPAVTWMYAAVFLCAFASLMWLRKRTDGWDTLAAAAAELGVLLTGLGLLTGAVWGRPTWGVYWVWDARLTSTAILFVLLLGYAALRRYPAEPEARSRMAAVLGLLLVPNALVVHFSVNWWRSLHQDATIKRIDVQMEGLMLFTLATSFVAMGLVCAWLLVHRFRVGWLERSADRHHLDAALADRRADADPSAGVAVGDDR
jgi:heme exporter protein C